MAAEESAQRPKKSILALEASNFFLADVQTGLGPFLAAYLAASGWNPARVGFAFTLGGIVTVVLQTPAGAVVDRVRSKRAILVIGVLVLAAGALLLVAGTSRPLVYGAQALIGAAGPFLAPTLAAITMGIVGKQLFDRQFGRNQAFNSAGNVVCAIGIGLVSHFLGNRAIFILAAVLVIPTIISVLCISSKDIDFDKARGCDQPDDEQSKSGALKELLSDRTLLVFMSCAFLFHFANAAMLPQLGELLSHGSPTQAAPFMSACIIVTQFVIMCGAALVARLANQHGRKPLLLIGFGVLPVRAILYTLTHWAPALIGIQLLDGVANAIFGVVSILVVADLTRGTGRFNFTQGALATAVGIGAALSPSFGGKLIQAFGFRVSFIALAGAALCAFFLLLFTFPETLHGASDERATQPQGEPA